MIDYPSPGATSSTRVESSQLTTASSAVSRADSGIVLSQVSQSDAHHESPPQPSRQVQKNYFTKKKKTKAQLDRLKRYNKSKCKAIKKKSVSVSKFKHNASVQEIDALIKDKVKDPESFNKELRKELIGGRALMNSLEILSRESQDAKHIVQRICASEELYSSGASTRVKLQCGINPRKRPAEHQLFEELGHKRKKKQENERMDRVRANIRKYFLDDSVTRQSPGKHDWVKVNGKKMQKRICNDYVWNSWERYNAENPFLQCSKATFYRNRPKHCLTSKYLTKDTTCCQRHQNFQLLCKSLHTIIPEETIPKFADSFSRKYSTQEQVHELLHKFDADNYDGDVSYEQWGRDTKKSDGKPKTKVLRHSLPPDQFLQFFMKAYEEFIEHNVRVQKQYGALKNLKLKLPRGHVIMQNDFIQNFACLLADAAQSSFFDQTQVTIHASVLYFYNEKGELEYISFIHVSGVNQHNKSMVQAILDQVWTVDMKHLIEELDISHVHYYSDSPTSQYRNRWMFQYIESHKERYGISASWDYFEAGHGKGPCDGLGGTIKRLAEDACKMGALIQDADDFLKWAQNSPSVKFKVFGISQEVFDASEKRCNAYGTVIQPVKGNCFP